MNRKASRLPGGSVPAALLALLFVALPGCHTSPRVPARHLLLVTLDTTRADRLGCYGHPTAGTSWLDALAARGTRFERAYAQVPLTLPSHMSILTGLYPTRTGVHANGETAARPGVRTLAAILSESGFLTAAAVGGYPVSGRFPVRAGFERFDDRMVDPRNPEGLERDAGEVAAAALRLVSDRGGRRVFLWAHFYDPHDPYAPPAPFRERFASDPYQGEIARVDAALADLSPRLDRALGEEPTLVCVVGDHGEGMGEHGESTHGFFLYEPTLRVPLILAGPGVPAGRTATGPVQAVDIVPTLLRLLGLPDPRGLDGSTIDLTGAREESGRRIYLETELPHRNYGWSPLHGVVEGTKKYISAPRPEMYDLEKDPGETHNILTGAPGSGAPARLEPLKAWLEGLRAADMPFRQASASSSQKVDPRLASLGYVGAGPDATATSGSSLAGATASELADPKDELVTYQRFQKAGQALERGDPEVALPLLDALLARRDTPGVRLQRATALRMSGRLDEASQELSRVERSQTDFPGIHLERAIILLSPGREQPHAALAEAETHIRQAPADARGFLYRGAAREMLQDTAGAESDYRGALELNPAYAAASLRLAALLLRAGRADEARSQLQRHLVLHPSDDQARGLLGSL